MFGIPNIIKVDLKSQFKMFGIPNTHKPNEYNLKPFGYVGCVVVFRWLCSIK